jgi:CheY-like chemotaxis protein
MLDGIRVLVVDDDDDARDLLATFLSLEGAQVQTAESADKALAVFRTRPPDVLLSDISMPGKDGYALIREIRDQEGKGGRVTPAIAITAFGKEHGAEGALRAGFSAYLGKPLDLDELCRSILELGRG